MEEGIRVRPGPHGDNCPPTCSSLHHQPDPVTAPMVREGYTAILAGGSITEIARTWNTAGIYGLTGRPWSASTVSLFLRAPRNAGLRAHNDEIVLDADGNPVMGTWPALVDEALWRSVQAVLNAPGRAPGRKTVRKHLLTGVLRCGKCGDRLSGLQIGGTKQIAYNCKGCRGVSVRAEHVEPLLEAVIAGRLAKPDAVDLLRADLHDEADAEALRTERATLLSRLNDIADERADGLLTGQQAKRASDRINEKLAAIEARQQDQEKLRVFDGIPLGHPEVADAVARLSPDRLRAVMAVLFTATVMPVGKGSHVFNPQRIKVGWL